MNNKYAHEYNWLVIGERIKTEREKLKLTQDELGRKVGVARQTLSKWERSEARPSLDDMVNLCNVFNCELGYLLCEYDCKTRTATDIKETIGLSEDAIDILTLFQEGRRREEVGYPPDPTLDILSYLLCTLDGEQDFFGSVVYAIERIFKINIKIKRRQKMLEEKYGDELGYKEEFDLLTKKEKLEFYEKIESLEEIGFIVLDEKIALENSIDAMLSGFKSYILYTLNLLNELIDDNLTIAKDRSTLTITPKRALISIYNKIIKRDEHSKLENEQIRQEAWDKIALEQQED